MSYESSTSFSTDFIELHYKPTVILA